jgi:hypothetical protein
MRPDLSGREPFVFGEPVPSVSRTASDLRTKAFWPIFAQNAISHR